MAKKMLNLVAVLYAKLLLWRIVFNNFCLYLFRLNCHLAYKNFKVKTVKRKRVFTLK